MKHNFIDYNTKTVSGVGWRVCLLEHFLNSKNEGDYYQFGVAGGFSMQVLGTYQRLIPQPTVPPKFFGFDVFTGMPVEAVEPEKQLDEPGYFKLMEIYKADSFEVAISRLVEDITYNLANDVELNIIVGLVQNQLNETFLQRCNPRPAFYVDMDMDIYSPTLYALDFMIKNKLIVEGTLIGFDDWGQNYPLSPTFTCGESRALREVCEKYGMLYETLHTTDNNQQTLIKVTKV